VLRQQPCDVKKLPLTSLEGFLLTQVDGRLTLGEIAEIHGIPLTALFPHADRLLELGAVGVVGELGAPPRSARAPSSRRPPRSARRPSQAPRTVRPRGSRPPPPAPAEVEDAARAKIHAFALRLGEADHYAALGVPRDADKASIKRAYFALAAEFHPDRYFGRNLGDARAVLSRVFARLTDAHDTLANRSRRAAYDATLSAARTAVATLPPSTASSPARCATTPPSPAQRRSSTQKMKAVDPAASRARITLEPRPRITLEPPLPRASVEPPPTGASSPPKSPEDYALYRMYRAAKQDDVRRRVSVFLEAAEAALSRGDPVAAANHYRLALHNHDDPLIRAKLAAIEEASQERLHIRHVGRAQAAEKGERWAEAAESYARAHTIRPEAWAAERAANAIRMGSGDLHRAIELAEQAVLAQPEVAAYHVTLGEVCLAAGLVKRAVAEADRALVLDSGNLRASALARAAKKGPLPSRPP
jgi:curved DNA-binding protein CbpA